MSASPVGPVGQGEAVETDEDAAIDAAYDAWDAVLGNRECHYVRWTLEQDRVRGTIVCEGPDDAGCRYYCAEGCEVYPCEHQPSLGKTCGVADWFEDGAECYYSGPVVPVHDGLIKLDWTGDGYEWRYAERAESRPVVSLRAREASPRVQGEPDALVLPPNPFGTSATWADYNWRGIAEDRACRDLWGLDEDGGVYLVGSARERPDFRDVDVRLILPDARFDALFGHASELWGLFCYAVSRQLAADTGLPIDFQVQRHAERVPGCFRCDLAADEARPLDRDALIEAADQAVGRAFLDVDEHLSGRVIDAVLPPIADAIDAEQVSIARTNKQFWRGTNAGIRWSAAVVRSFLDGQ